MKSKGFTLIELLAVIVILALIALVTIPMINNVIEKAKKGALEDSVYGLKSAAELYYSTTGTNETIEFDCTEEGCISGNKKLPFKGTVNEGKVKLFSDGKISICIENDNYASSILAEEKKVTTTTGSCDYTKEEYVITELVSANEYKKVKEDYSKVKNALLDKTIISSISNTSDTIVSEIELLDLNQGEAVNKKTIVDSLKYSELGITEDMSWEEIAGILSNRFNDISTGTVWNFAYTGNIQTWTCPATGLYMLEVYGGQGGGNNGGNGGYSKGYLELESGDILYVVVGGSGLTPNTTGYFAGGYNGGGRSYCTDYGHVRPGSGGGATHIATVTGTLEAIGVSNLSKILIVAGGGGGGGWAQNYSGTGGTGGGTNGADGKANGGSGENGSTSNWIYPGKGGSQSIGGAQGMNGSTGAFGIGGSANSNGGTGGGGGLYGGGTGGTVVDFWKDDTTNGAGGGSGYVGGMPQIKYNGVTYDSKMSNGTNSGAGKAVITFIAK